MDITANYTNHQIVLTIGMDTTDGQLSTIAGINSEAAARLVRQLQAAVEQCEADPLWDELPNRLPAA